MSIDDIYRKYRALNARRCFFLMVMVIVLFTSLLTSIAYGSADMSFAEVVQALIKDNGQQHAILWALRVPRTLMAALVGFGLGVSGAVFQAVLRNPLASSSTLGIASAAGFGAVCVILLIGVSASSLSVALGAFICALFSAGFIFAIARMKGASSETLILTGVAQMFLFSALTSLAQYMGTVDQLVNIVFWSLGNLSKAGWTEITFTAGMVMLPTPFLILRAWDFNLLAMGDETATASGINVMHLRLWSIALASLATAGAICFTGVIGFVGLVAPHITRMVIGNDHQYLLPASAIIGAALVVCADILGRIVLAPQIIPIGIVTALLGVPFFFYLLMNRKQENW